VSVAFFFIREKVLMIGVERKIQELLCF